MPFARTRSSHSRVATTATVGPKAWEIVAAWARSSSEGEVCGEEGG
jgi:hypothetical protein